MGETGKQTDRHHETDALYAGRYGRVDICSDLSLDHPVCRICTG